MTTTIEPRTGMQLSATQFLDLPETDDKRKMELDDGALYIMPRPRPSHQFLQRRLCTHFDAHFDALDEPVGQVFHDIVLGLPSELPRLFSPDLVVILQGSDAVVGELMVEGVPDIVVEILSSDRNRDLVRKRQVYAEAGIPEYWIVDQNADTVTPLELRDGVYRERGALSADDTLTTPLLPGLEIPLDAIFRHRSRPPTVR